MQPATGISKYNTFRLNYNSFIISNCLSFAGSQGAGADPSGYWMNSDTMNHFIIIRRRNYLTPHHSVFQLKVCVSGSV